MATDFPTGLDSFSNPQEPANPLHFLARDGSVRLKTDPDTIITAADPELVHSTQHANINDAVEALQAKVGINGSADANSIDYKLTQKQPLAAVLTNTTASFTTAQEAKLAGIATGATANDTDANLKNRANHTGTQTASTISDFDAEVIAAPLTGFTSGAGTVSAADTILQAFQKIVGNIAAFATALVTGKVTAATSGGLTLEASNGTDIAIMGVGNSANVEWYGNHNFDAATASTIATFGASKTLTSGGAFSETQTLNSSSAPTGTVFTGTTAPSGAVNYDLVWQQIGKRVDVSISVYYATAGSSITRQTFDFPSGLPAPLERSGFTAADIPQYAGSGYAITTTATTYTNGNTFCGITRNAADSAYQIVHQFSSGSYRAFLLQFTYYTA